MFRRVLFWCHLAAGLVVGVVVLIMSVTGVILTYEKQMLAWDDKRAAAVVAPGAGTPRASIDEIVDQARRTAPDTTITAITRRQDPEAPVTVALASGTTLLMHPYTGQVIGNAPTGMRRVFRASTDWHRYLAGTGDNRALGKAVTGASNLAFLFLVLSGLYLWMPRRWTTAAVTAVSRPRWRHATGKARDFNWHNALGFWSAIPLAVVVASATVISYPWASDLAYRIMGEVPPARSGPPGAGARSPAARSGGAPDRGATAPAPVPDNLEARWQLAEAQVRDWQTIALRLPASAEAPLAFSVDRGYGGQPQLRGTLTLGADAKASKWETFADQSAGRRFRSMLRFAHTGEYWGLPGQTVAGIVSAGACVLVWTGFALAWRRFATWRTRRLQPHELKRAA